MKDNEPAISVADFTTLQQELLRLKYENYDLQNQVQRAQNNKNGTVQDKKTSWSFAPQLGNNFANMVSAASAAMPSTSLNNVRKNGRNSYTNETALLNGIAASSEAAPFTVQKEDSPTSVSGVEQQLKAVQAKYSAYVTETDQKIAILLQDTEKLRTERDEVRRYNATLQANSVATQNLTTDVPSSSSTSPTSEKRVESQVAYLAKIQQQQGEIDTLREKIDTQGLELRKLREDGEATRRLSGGLTTQKFLEEKKRLESNQQDLQTRLNEALSESKQAFAMKVMIQSMGKKINDNDAAISQQKQRANQKLQESNRRWERELFPMAVEDIRSQIFKYRREEELQIALTNKTPVDQSLPCGSYTEGGSSSSSPQPRRRASLTNAEEEVANLRKERDTFRNEVTSLHTKIEDLEREMVIVRRQGEEKLLDLQNILRRRIENDKKVSLASTQLNISPNILTPRNTTSPITPNPPRQRQTSSMIPQRHSSIAEQFVIASSDDDESGSSSTPTLSSPMLYSSPGGLSCLQENQPAVSVEQLSPKNSSELPGLGDSLYLIKISELEALCEGLNRDLDIVKESENLLKEDVAHKRSMINHMLKKLPALNNTSPREDTGHLFSVARSSAQEAAATFFPTLFPTGSTGNPNNEQQTHLERVLEEQMADNLLLRDNVRILSEQLRQALDDD